MAKFITRRAETQRYLELLWGMTEKELRARYKYTIFGFFWILINPVIQMLIIGFVFRFFMKESIENYYYFLFIGLLAWNFFSLALSKATPSIVYERSLIKKAKFSRSIIPLAIVLSDFIHMLAAIALLAIPVLFLGTIAPFGLVYILIAFFMLIMFTSGICLLSSALNVRFRDINFFVQAFLMFWFYATPIIYPLSIIPYRYYWLWRFNPMTSILQLLQHGFLNMSLPGTAMITINFTIIITIFVAGIIVFRKESKNFDDWV
jgi:ABC-type polysaccharide/polyol phosphate export permease